MPFVSFNSETTAFLVRPEQVTHIERKGETETVIYFVGNHFITVMERVDQVARKLQGLPV